MKVTGDILPLVFKIEHISCYNLGGSFSSIVRYTIKDQAYTDVPKFAHAVLSSVDSTSTNRAHV